MARKRGNRWQADVLIDGKRVRRSFTTREQAELFEAKPEAAGCTLDTLFKAVFEQRWIGTKNEADVVRNMNCVIDYLGEHTTIDDLDELAIDRFIAHLRNQGNKPPTINRKLSVLSVALNHAYRRRMIPRLPYIPRFRESRGRLRWLSEEEADRLLAAFETSDSARLARFLLETGCRMGEARRLTWRHVHDELAVFADTKNGQTRSVPLTRAAKEAVGDLVGNPECRVFDIRDSSFRREFTRARERAGLGPDVTPHILRHTFASWAVQRGVPVAMVQKWLGHLCISVTMRYAHLAQDDLLRVRDLMERGQRLQQDSRSIGPVQGSANK